jgi:hypothetical protein
LDRARGRFVTSFGGVLLLRQPPAACLRSLGKRLIAARFATEDSWRLGDQRLIGLYRLLTNVLRLRPFDVLLRSIVVTLSIEIDGLLPCVEWLLRAAGRWFYETAWLLARAQLLSDVGRLLPTRELTVAGVVPLL